MKSNGILRCGMINAKIAVATGSCHSACLGMPHLMKVQVILLMRKLSFFPLDEQTLLFLAPSPLM